jgi:hypothetical protein
MVEQVEPSLLHMPQLSLRVSEGHNRESRDNGAVHLTVDKIPDNAYL